MNLIDKLLPVITLILGWGLAEIGKFSTNRKNDQKETKEAFIQSARIEVVVKKRT